MGKYPNTWYNLGTYPFEIRSYLRNDTWFGKKTFGNISYCKIDFIDAYGLNHDKLLWATVATYPCSSCSIRYNIGYSLYISVQRFAGVVVVVYDRRGPSSRDMCRCLRLSNTWYAIARLHLGMDWIFDLSYIRYPAGYQVQYPAYWISKNCCLVSGRMIGLIPSTRPIAKARLSGSFFPLFPSYNCIYRLTLAEARNP